MKGPVIISFLALVVSAVAIAATLVKSSPIMVREEAPIPSSPGASNDELLARVQALSEENVELRERLTALELRPEAEPRAPVPEVGASAGELAALQEEVRLLKERRGAGPLAPGEVPSPEFTEQVRQSLVQIDRDKAYEAARRAVLGKTTRLKERMPDLVNELGLTVAQEAAMETALVGMYETQANYKVMWETGEIDSRADFGPIVKQDTAEFLAEVGNVLTAQQYDTYLTLQGDLFPGAQGGRK